LQSDSRTIVGALRALLFDAAAAEPWRLLDLWTTSIFLMGSVFLQRLTSTPLRQCCSYSPTTVEP
jgi:hypothetical protein